MKRTLAAPLLAALALPGCGPVEPCSAGSMLDGPAGLELTQAEHELGWGQADCWLCHSQASIHRLGCTPGVDLQAVQEQVVQDDLASCASCHGGNGLPVAQDGDTGGGDTGADDAASATADAMSRAGGPR